MSELVEPRKSWRGWLSDALSLEPSDRAELLALLADARDREIVDVEELNIIHGAIAVAEMQARDIMIPRAQLVTVKADARVGDFLPIVIDSRHSRFPVVGDDAEDVRGILHAKDLLPLVARSDHSGFDMKDYIRPVTVVPESKRLNVLLEEFKATRNHMAIVVDEYGHVAGAVTIEDVLEQIVGEIEDEYDIDDDSFINAHDDGTFTVKATSSIDDFNEYFECSLGDDEFDTVGGLVLREFGHLPQRGESVAVGLFHFRVLNADSRRIRLLHLRCET